MSKEFSTKFYNSKAWKLARSSYIKSVFNLCEQCKGAGYIVHHKKHITPDNINNPEITLSHDNLMYLCTECHNQIHGNNLPVREDVMFDSQAQLIKKRMPPGH